MRSILKLLITSLLLTACDPQAQSLAPTATLPATASPPPQQSTTSIDTAQAVIDRLKGAGLSILDNLPEANGEEAVKAMVKDLEPFYVREQSKAYLGMMILCDTKATCDAIYNGDQQAVSDGIIGMWRSQDGLIVCKMRRQSDPDYDTDKSPPSTLSAATESQIQQIIEALR
jgi:hypothetical protein